MITRPNLDLLSALAPNAASPVLTAGGPAAQNLRFDAAMLDAAKTLRDGSREGVERTLTPKVEQALESLLQQLAQQPADQVRQWASQPELLKPALESMARAQGLNAEETAEFLHTAPLAPKALIQAFESIKSAGNVVSTVETPEPISGPQGREPGTTAAPAKTLKPQAPRLTPRPEGRETELPATLAQASLWAGTVVSTRTDAGSGADSSLSLSSRPVESVSAPVANPPVLVKVSATQPETAAAAQPGSTPVQAQPTQPQAAPAPTVTGTAAPQGSPIAENSQSTVLPRQTPPSTALDFQPAGKTPVQEEAAPARDAKEPKAPSETQASVRTQAPQRSDNGSRLNFQVSSAPTDGPGAPVQEGSLFVLNSDGRSEGVRQLETQPGSTSQPLQASAPAPQASPAAELNAGLQPQAPVQQASSTQESPAKVPPVAAEEAPLPSSPPQTLSEKPASSRFEPSALQQSAGFRALERSSHDDAPQTGLAFGQESLRQVLKQVARELGVRESAFTQVSEALAQAGKENSRLVIKLKPASLGEVQVDLSVEGGKLNARLLASTVEVRDAFVRDLPAFKASLEAQGLKIDQLSVAVRAESNFNPQGRNQGQGQPQGWSFQRPLAPAVPELNAALSGATWSGPASFNDQRFSALA